MSRYSTLHRGAIIAALDRFNANAGDPNTAFDDDYPIHALQSFGIPLLEVFPISWTSSGRGVAGINPQAGILRQTGMRTFRRVYAVGVTPGAIPRSGSGCAVLDFSVDGLTIHFSPDGKTEPVEMSFGDALDAVVDLFKTRYGEVA